jgi:hypothetical protein
VLFQKIAHHKESQTNKPCPDRIRAAASVNMRGWKAALS